MTSINFALQTAQAAYSTFDGLEPNDVVNALKDDRPGARFSASQANQFANRYQVIAHAPNDGTGFSATVFAENNPGGSPRYTIAMRGTEAGVDPIEDLLKADLLEIGGAGYAARQTASMYRLYKRLTIPKGQAVKGTPPAFMRLAGQKSARRRVNAGVSRSSGAEVAHE